MTQSEGVAVMRSLPDTIRSLFASVETGDLINQIQKLHRLNDEQRVSLAVEVERWGRYKSKLFRVNYSATKGLCLYNQFILTLWLRLMKLPDQITA